MRYIPIAALALLATTLFSCRSVESDVAVKERVTHISAHISTPEVRTSLGERAEDSYPLYWSDGDRLTINGELTSCAIIDKDNPRMASFSTEKEVTCPLNVIYPAAEDGRIRFLAQQSYVQGSFCAGAVPMYGCATTQSVTMRHLCALVRFDIKGSITLSSLTITASQGDLAGSYTIDCATGALSDKRDGTPTVSYSFGDGLTLAPNDAQACFVALPTGTYGVCTVELLATNGKSMTLRFDSEGDKALKAGVVREFKPVTFKAGSEFALEDIESEEDTMLIPTHLRAMAYNVRNCKGTDGVLDYQRVANVIKSMDVDVVALQELDSCTTRSSMLYSLGELAEKTGMYPTFCASRDARDGTDGKIGNGILSKEKPLSVRRVPLPCSDKPRSILIVEMEDYYYCSTHLSLIAEYRTASALIIVDELSKLDKPVLAGGDFNAKPTEESMQYIGQYCHILKKMMAPYTYPSENPTKEIDYIILYKAEGLEYEVNSHFVLNEPVASDHCPIVADIVVCINK